MILSLHFVNSNMCSLGFISYAGKSYGSNNYRGKVCTSVRLTYLNNLLDKVFNGDNWGTW